LKQRLDLLLVEKKLAETRHQAQALILAGRVKVNHSSALKPGDSVSDTSFIEVVEPFPYVGKGGIKLAKALQVFQVNPKGKICLDIGASTGGFTDCLLQNGAAKVYAVDVGKGQLSWKLRTDPRVVSLERTNARYLTAAEIPEAILLCVMDVSFISVQKILPAARDLMLPHGEILVLIKPQFEAERGAAKKGVIREKEIHEKVLHKMMEWLEVNAFFVQGITHSPVSGAEGNIEFLCHLSFEESREVFDLAWIVEKAHQELKENQGRFPSSLEVKE
jgi:23S rRNA (cytidine1920-2'-O)/16S rRNA (cytidine1409-2'-O)-methyltransferase